MSRADEFRRRLRAGPPLLLDAAMGTELERRGVRCALPLWSAWALLEAPGRVLEIHREEAAAGAEVLTANTFRTHGRSLGKEGRLEEAAGLTKLAVSLARRAASEAPRPAWVAGSLSPLEDCYRPDLVADDSVLEAEHVEQAIRLADAGADLILAETHNSARELAAAVRAARATGLPVVASMTTDGSGRLLSGEPIADAVRALADAPPDAWAVNCVPAGSLLDDLRALAAAAPAAPLAAYGNLGPPSDADRTVFSADVPPHEYARLASGWLDAGARMIGGCCGTTPRHTAALRSLLDSRDPRHATNIASP